MTRNVFGGKKAKKMSRFRSHQNKSRTMIYKADMQDYAEVTRLLGDCRCEIKLSDERMIIGHIRGKLKKKTWIRVGDIVLISYRDFQMDKFDIVHRDSEEESSMIQPIFSKSDDVVDIDDDEEFIPEETLGLI